ncbi:MAG: leucine-rich repeat protein [Oscillospiraceae bacterium]|nr:leucine-rich repeat protein [Oscillospiraceae bacterium]
MKKQINFNKVVSVFLAFTILLSMVPGTVKANDSDIVYYKVSEDEKTLTLTMNNPGPRSAINFSKVENVIIEEGVDRINEISPSLRFSINVKNVKMPNSLKTIGTAAFFGWTLLTNIDIPDGVTTIRNSAFSCCNSLKKIKLPESVTTIEDHAFSECDALTEINIPKGITTIEEYTFGGCSSLKNIEIPEGVVNIERIAFAFCSSLESINIPQSVTSIGEEAFKECTSLKDIVIPESITTIESKTFRECTSLENITIPESVTEIKSKAFEECTSLKDIVIPEGITCIDEYTFSECTSLENITIPESVKRIRRHAFDDCTALKSIRLSKKVEYIESPVFENCENLTIYCYENSAAHKEAEKDGINYVLLEENDPYTFDITQDGKLTITINADIDSLDIPEKVNDINVKSVDCINTKNVTQKYKIEHISFPDTLENIEDNAFVGCGIREISFPNSLKTIGKEAFINNDFKEIEIPESVQKIEDGAFRNCQDLEKITIPHDVQIVSNPFGGCYKLTIYCYYGSSAQQCAEKYGIKYELINNIITINGITYALDEDNKTAKVIEVKKEAISAYGTLAFPDEIEPIEKEQYTVTEICAGAVKLDGIKSIQLPNKLTTIRNNAFEKYTGDVFIPGTVSYLDINAFATHDVYKSDFHKSMRENENFSMELYTIRNIYALKNKNGNVLYGFLTDFDDEMKYFCLDSDVTEIGDRAFKYCHNFKRIKIGNKVNKIGYDAFDGIEDQVIIVGYSGSYAERYAKQHNITFESETIFFNWGEDNYSFYNSPSYFDSYDVGELINYYPNSLKEYAEVRRKEEWRGSCEGMAITAILFKMGVLSQENWQNANEKADSTYQLIPTDKNKKLKELINFYHLLQTGVEKNYSTKLYKGNDFEKFYDSVVSYYDDNSEKNDDEKLLVCAFMRKNAEEGHAVIITGKPQELDATFYINRGISFSEKNYYGFRIPIYDENDYTPVRNYYLKNDYSEERYLYIKNDFSRVGIDTDSEIYSHSDDIVSFVVYSISKKEVPDIETLMENNECVKLSGYVNFMYKNTTRLLIKDNNKTKKEAIIEGTNKVSGELECDISPIYNSSAVDENNEISEAYASFAEGENYSVEPLNSTEPLDIKLLTKDSYMSVKTTEGGKATFENNKTLSLSNPSGKEFEAVFTVNDEYMKLPWYTIKLSGENSKDIKIESTEEGYVVTGDNLKNIKLTANNLEEKTELTLNTDTEKVLLKASKGDKELVVAEGEKIADVKEADLDVYEDKDNDGTFETKTQTATISNLTEDDAAEPEFENSQYDIDGNSVINTSDIVKLSHILIAPEKYADLKDKADLNSDGTTDVSDLLTLVRFMKQ